MKKTIIILLLLIGFSGVESVNAQNQNYLPEYVQRVPQAKFIEAYKIKTGFTDEDLSFHAYEIWATAWFGKISCQNGEVKILYIPKEWNNGHFATGGQWKQGNYNMPYPAESKILNALNDLQMRAEQIMGTSLPPLESELPNKYVERILNYLPVEGVVSSPSIDGSLF